MGFSNCRQKLSVRLVCALVTLVFGVFSLCPPAVLAGVMAPLPVPGAPLALSPAFEPVQLLGIQLHPENPLRFDFLMTPGEAQLNPAAFRDESTRLIKYFLAALTVRETEMWVNLSPYEKDRIIPATFGQTEMGRDVLALDYMLKQLTASLMNPENELGEKFWQRVRAGAMERFGTSEVPLNTFHKIWIVPERARVYEHARGAVVVDSHLKVLLEEDYLAQDANQGRVDHGVGKFGVDGQRTLPSGIAREIIREVLIPEIEREVNQGATFANLRQIYGAVILASWFKQALRKSVLGQAYADQGKVRGVDEVEDDYAETIYQQYLSAYETGASALVRDEYDPVTQSVIPRQYFSGGLELNPEVEASRAMLTSGEERADFAMRATDARVVTADLSRPDRAMKVVETSEDFVQLRNSINEDLPVDDGMTYEIKRRISGHLDKIRQTRESREQSTAKGRRVIINKNDPHFDPNDSEDGGEDVNVGILAISANPVHWGHLETALRAMAEHQYDQVVIIVQGDDFRKPILKDTEAARHGMVRLWLENLGGLLVYSDWSRGNENIGEQSTEEMVFRNIEAGRKGRVTWHYVVGNDHGHWWAPDGGSVDENGVRLRPKGQPGSYEMDTIQRIYQTREKIINQKSNADIKVALNVRNEADGVPMEVEKARLQEISNQGFVYQVLGENLPDTSSTKLRKVLAGSLPASEASFLPRTMYDYIMQQHRYRGYATDLPIRVRSLADTLRRSGRLGESEKEYLDQLMTWLDIVAANGDRVTSQEFYQMFYEGIDQDQHGPDGRVVRNAQPDVYVDLKGVSLVFQKVAEVMATQDADPAMAGRDDNFTKGGIDLNPALNTLDIDRAGAGFVLPPMDAAMLRQIRNAPGLVPVIIQIAPVVNLPMLLGWIDSPETEPTFTENPIPYDWRFLWDEQEVSYLN